MTYDQFLIVSIACLFVLLVVLIRKIIRDQLSQTSKGNQSVSDAGTDGYAAIAAGQSFGNSDCGDGGGGGD